jgi:hypothetical protein
VLVLGVLAPEVELLADEQPAVARRARDRSERRRRDRLRLAVLVDPAVHVARRAGLEAVEVPDADLRVLKLDALLIRGAERERPRPRDQLEALQVVQLELAVACQPQATPGCARGARVPCRRRRG